MFGRKFIAELAEVDENLVRSQFTPAQEASAIFRRAWRSVWRSPWRRPRRRDGDIAR
jgi:hypothetical protein